MNVAIRRVIFILLLLPLRLSAQEFDDLAKEFAAEVSETLRGQSLEDLAMLRNVARGLVDELEAEPESRPYAAWLRARLDELDVAEELQSNLTEPGPLQPTAVQVRKAWAKLIGKEPVTTRATVLVRTLKPIFRSERVPAELVWLAEVESGFDTRAISPVGAAGLFQLMPDTAKFLGLLPADRFEVAASGRAAARYLRYLMGKFRDWPLTLAAYNAGEGRVRRLLEKRNAKTFEAIAGELPVETRLYVPKIDAVIQRREGVGLADLTKQGTE